VLARHRGPARAEWEVSNLARAPEFRRAAGTTGQRQLALKIVVPLASVVLILIFGEALVRLLASRTPAGLIFLNTLLLPRSWDDVRTRHRDLLKRMSGHATYLVADEMSGRTVGPNRESGRCTSAAMKVFGARRSMSATRSGTPNIGLRPSVTRSRSQMKSLSRRPGPIGWSNN